MMISGVTGGRGQGTECPPTLLTGKFLLIYREKRGNEKGENGEEKKENWKGEGGKLKMEGGKVENHWNLFWVYQNGSFLAGKKHFTPGKNQENGFAPSEIFSSYALDDDNDSILSYAKQTVVKKRTNVKKDKITRFLRMPLPQYVAANVLRVQGIFSCTLHSSS